MFLQFQVLSSINYLECSTALKKLVLTCYPVSMVLGALVHINTWLYGKEKVFQEMADVGGGSWGTWGCQPYGCVKCRVRAPETDLVQTLVLLFIAV